MVTQDRHYCTTSHNTVQYSTVQYFNKENVGYIRKEKDAEKEVSISSQNISTLRVQFSSRWLVGKKLFVGARGCCNKIALLPSIINSDGSEVK
jgi:hypothetical protein